jgi:hypothetical protein
VALKLGTGGFLGFGRWIFDIGQMDVFENKVVAQNVIIKDGFCFCSQAQGTARNVKGFALCVNS